MAIQKKRPTAEARLARYRMGLAGLVLAGLATNWGWLGWSWHFCQINFQINFGIDLGKVGVKGQLFDGLS
ncbi:hypothetical protein BY996DRAFT_6562215 [Phakopsora pachyrhizi]|nr:hypothetical protein BY996DRAFT_6562215 [Phakopsora pachyrhizi]